MIFTTCACITETDDWLLIIQHLADGINSSPAGCGGEITTHWLLEPVDLPNTVDGLMMFYACMAGFRFYLIVDLHQRR